MLVQKITMTIIFILLGLIVACVFGQQEFKINRNHNLPDNTLGNEFSKYSANLNSQWPFLHISNYKTSNLNQIPTNFHIVVSDSEDYVEYISQIYSLNHKENKVIRINQPDAPIKTKVPLPNNLSSELSVLERISHYVYSLNEEKNSFPILLVVDFSNYQKDQQLSIRNAWIVKELKYIFEDLEMNDINFIYNIILSKPINTQNIQNIQNDEDLSNTRIATQINSVSDISTTTYPTDDERANYQMMIWSSITVVVLLIVGFLTMNSIDYSKDSMLYAAGSYM